jgi:hypothetical protein
VKYALWIANNVEDKNKNVAIITIIVPVVPKHVKSSSSLEKYF